MSCRIGCAAAASRLPDRHLRDDDPVQRGMGRHRRKNRTPDRAPLAAGGALAAIPLTWRWTLQQGAALDLSPSQHWGMPQTHEEIDNDRGPVLVKIEYRIDPKDRVAFLRALDELGFERRRDGAFAWGIFEDAGECRPLRGDLPDRVVARAHAFARAGHQRRSGARGRDPGDADRAAAHRIPHRRRTRPAASASDAPSRPERSA